MLSRAGYYALYYTMADSQSRVSRYAMPYRSFVFPSLATYRCIRLWARVLHSLRTLRKFPAIRGSPVGYWERKSIWKKQRFDSRRNQTSEIRQGFRRLANGRGWGGVSIKQANLKKKKKMLVWVMPPKFRYCSAVVVHSPVHGFRYICIYAQ